MSAAPDILSPEAVTGAHGSLLQRLVRPIAALCVSRNSPYKRMEGVDAYDMDRDATTFDGGKPVVAHPPCRAWSRHCAHQAKPLPGEKDLGLFCAEALRTCGGVLEHPAGSRLFDAAGLPKPGERDGSTWTIEVWQAWWGYPMKKATWLCFHGVLQDSINLPFRLHPRGGDRRREQLMSKTERSATVPAMAEWLVAAARSTPAWIPCRCCENYICTLHGEHAHDCECPPIEEWDSDPYAPWTIGPNKQAERPARG